VLVHPLAAFAVHQRVVPLGVEIAKYGTAPVEGERRFDITNVRVNGTSLAASARTPVTDSFAPGEFFDLTDDQKLSRPSFETFSAGVAFGAGGITFCTLRLEPSQEQIALRAYQRYRERSRPREVQDWLAAEYELTHPPHAQIQLRAYFKYVARGKVPGRALDDWLAAEAELSRPTPQQIAQRAYFRHMARGPLPSQALDDWVNARAELTGPSCVVTRPAAFDVIVIDDDGAPARTMVDVQQPVAVAVAQFTTTEIAAPPRTLGAGRYASPPRTRLRVQPPAFAVASTQDFTVTRLAATFTEAIEELGKIAGGSVAARTGLQVIGRHERETV
jgi:hypothetical protein